MQLDSPQVLVISCCTGKKLFKPANLLSADDLLTSEVQQRKEREMARYARPACNMYAGDQHLRLMEGLRLARDELGEEVMDLAIVSAGYGLLEENEVIVPYDATFRGMRGDEIDRRATLLGIHEAATRLVRGYDLIFYLLGKEYLRAIVLPLKVREGSKQIFFTSKAAAGLIPRQNGVHMVMAGNDVARRHRVKALELKGYLFKLLCEQLVRQRVALLQNIYRDPQIVLSLLDR